MSHSFIVKIEDKYRRIRDYLKNEFIYFCMNYSLEEKKMHLFRKIIFKCFLRGRKLVGFYGECHIYVYGSLLKQSNEFKQKYAIVGEKEIEYLVKHHKQIRKRSMWDKLDVLIYNPGIPLRPGVPSLSDVLEWVPLKAKKIEVTNATFVGYMPQHTSKVYKNDGYFTWGDKNLNNILKLNDNINEKIEELGKDEYYSEKEVLDYFSKSIKKLSIYEKKCTIKIADYIEKYGKKRILYYSVTHPETEIMIELTRRIAEQLNVFDINCTDYKDSLQYNLHSHGEVIYPSVCKALGINVSLANERKIQPGDYKVEYGFNEYVKEYIKRARISEVISND